MNVKPFNFIAAVFVPLLLTSYAYVREQKLLIKPVYFRSTPSILHASAGFRTHSDKVVNPSTRSRWNAGGHQDVAKWRSSGVYRIPRDFVLSARLRAFDPTFVDGIRTKRNTWAVSTPHEQSNPEPTYPRYPLRDAKVDTSQPENPTQYAYKSFGTSEGHPTQFDGENWVDDENDDEFSDDGLEETMPTDSDARIRQQYIPGQNHSAIWRPFEIDGYKPYEEEEATEPVHAVRRSPSPWPKRDTTQLGTPRQLACTLPLDRGIGPDDISSWHYSPDERRCRWFGYRGHGGNANRFYSRAACEAYCIRDLENMCEAVTCSWPGTTCNLMEDRPCKDTERNHGREWRLKCPPDHPVCLSRRNTRMSPDITFGLIPPECFQPKDSGTCERKNPSVSYYYDGGRNACMTFYFHNCGGNDNRFNTKSDCMTHCSP
ncbi:unnamed protein product [Dicrocoelium dendriticum]|nr:unnamed protein product [Dicrocoelium dendriticum]